MIDDIWSVSALEALVESLPNGGAIVVTTRFKSVSEACRRHNGYVHKHRQLSPKSSVKLFLETSSNAADKKRTNINDS